MKRSWIRACALLALLAGRAPLRAADELSAEPPPLPGTRELYFPHLPFLQFAPLDLWRPEAGRLSFAADAAYANTFSHTWHAAAIAQEFHTFGQPFSRFLAEKLHERHPADHINFIDGEVTRFSFRGVVGVSRFVALAVEVPVISWSALHLDHAIEDFHSAVGLRDYQRTYFPRNRFQIVRQRPSGDLEFDDRTPASGLGDAIVSARFRYRLPDGTRLSGDVSLKLPTGDADDYRGSGSLDVGALAGLFHRFGGDTGRLGLRFEVGLVRPGRFRGDVPVRFEVSTYAHVLLGGELRIGRKRFLSVTGILEQSPFHDDNVGDGSKAAVVIQLGLAREIGPHLHALLSLTENMPQFGDAADVAASVGLSYRP